MKRAGSSFHFIVVVGFLAAGAGAVHAQASGQVFDQGPTPNFIVSMEAESFRTNTPGTGSSPHTWNLVATPTGFSGTGAMQASPDTGQNTNTGYTDPASGSCRLDFKVNFSQTGFHYVWARGRALPGSLVGSSDSCHVGLDWQASFESDRLNSFNDTWAWRRLTMDGNNARFDVTSAGVHTVNVWMREDGFMFDKIVLTTSSTYDPNSAGATGPAQSGTIATPAPVIVSPLTLGNGATGSPYSVTFWATGSGPFTWSTTGILPSMLSMNAATGVYSGTPNTVETQTFTVTVTAAEGGSANLMYTHQILPGPTGPAYITGPESPLPDGEEGTNYRSRFYAAGAPVLNWTVFSGSLPPGMTLDLFSGDYDGTPSAAGTYTFTIRASNAQPPPSDRVYTHTIKPPPSIPPTSISPGSPLLDWDQGASFSITFTASGASGPGGITWSSSGTLPSGMTLNATTGDFTGMPTPAGDYSFLITAENPGGAVTQAYTWKILPAPSTPPTIDGPAPTLPPGTVGQSYQAQFAATGSPTITWSVSGTLPPGITLDSFTGLYSGSPLTAGTYTFDVTATNGFNPNATRTYTHMINAATSGVPAITGPSSPLPPGTVGGAYSTQFTATGTAPITWSVSSGSLPPGITLNSGTGGYSGMPTAGGTFTFQVTASNSAGSVNQSYSHTVSAPSSGSPTITGPASPLPTGTVGVSYSSGFTATGAAPITWSVTVGSLPPGLSLNPNTGAYLGTPTLNGAYTFTVTATNSAGSDSVAYSHTISVGTPVTPAITGPATPLPTGTQGTAYSVTFTATGTTPLTWAMSIPVPGLTLNTATGVLSGSPTTPGPYSFDVTVTNSAGSAGPNTYSLTIVAAGGAPAITGPSSPLPNGTVGSAYSATFTATGAATITWAITGGTQPPGLTLNSAGSYTGTPNTPGTYNFTVTATNGSGSDSNAYQHTIVAAAAPPTITSPSSPLSPGTAGSAYSAPFTATGTTPITWGVTAGAMPTGMSLNSTTGVYSGTPSVAGTYNFTVTATNAGGSDSNPFQHVINPASGGPPLITGPASPLVAGTVTTPYSVSFVATGAAPITWGVLSGTLPPGMALAGATGAYTGTPTTAGTYNFTLQATNTSGNDTRAYVHTINPAGGGSAGGGGGKKGGCGCNSVLWPSGSPWLAALLALSLAAALRRRPGGS